MSADEGFEKLFKEIRAALDLAERLDLQCQGNSAWHDSRRKIHRSVRRCKRLALLHPEAAVCFARIVITRQWKAAERIILTSPDQSYVYARDVLGRRWPAGESVVASDPTAAANYAMYVMKERWVAAEPTISKNDSTAERYAEQLVRHWTPEFAKQSPVWLYMYADRVSCGKLPPELHNRMLLWSFDDTMKNNGWVRKYFAGRKFKKR